mmetsp:Transcript_22008/g.63455  ORF Transcript_22008/g.63455 Transcript_22008/m.63455 type:complete len:90 (+) Transcript_22008:1445-1714(+)
MLVEETGAEDRRSPRVRKSSACSTKIKLSDLVNLLVSLVWCQKPVLRNFKAAEELKMARKTTCHNSKGLGLPLGIVVGMHLDNGDNTQA